MRINIKKTFYDMLGENMSELTLNDIKVLSHLFKVYIVRKDKWKPEFDASYLNLEQAVNNLIKNAETDISDISDEDKERILSEYDNLKSLIQDYKTVEDKSIYAIRFAPQLKALSTIYECIGMRHYIEYLMNVLSEMPPETPNRYIKYIDIDGEIPYPNI